MSGAAKKLDELEESARKNPLADPAFRGAGTMKRDYGQKRNVDTSEGYLAGKEEKAKEEAEAAAAKDAANAKAAADAAAEAAVQKSQQAQVETLKRKGRRAAILTSASGVSDQLGNPG